MVILSSCCFQIFAASTSFFSADHSLHSRSIQLCFKKSPLLKLMCCYQIIRLSLMLLKTSNKHLVYWKPFWSSIWWNKYLFSRRKWYSKRNKYRHICYMIAFMFFVKWRHVKRATGPLIRLWGYKGPHYKRCIILHAQSLPTHGNRQVPVRIFSVYISYINLRGEIRYIQNWGE